MDVLTHVLIHVLIQKILSSEHGKNFQSTPSRRNPELGRHHSYLPSKVNCLAAQTHNASLVATHACNLVKASIQCIHSHFLYWGGSFDGRNPDIDTAVTTLGC